MRRSICAPLLLGLLLANTASIAGTSVEDFVAHPKYRDLQISPDGRHLAVIAPIDGINHLVFLNIKDIERPVQVGVVGARAGSEIFDIEWVNDERVVLRTSRIQGALELPSATGRILAVNYDGSRKKEIWSIEENGTFAQILDTLDDDDDYIIISHQGRNRQKPIVERLNVYSGRSSRLGISPLNRGGVLLDNQQNIRFAAGQTDDLEIQVVYRKEPGGDWIKFENPLGGTTTPIGISGDDQTVYLTSDGKGQLGMHAMDMNSGEIKPIAVHERAELNAMMLSRDGRDLIGVEFEPGLPETVYVNEDHEDADYWRLLQSTFEGMQVRATSITSDNKLAVISTSSDKQPITWYLYNIDEGKINFLVSSRPEIDPELMSDVEPYWITARDGLEFQLYVTRPLNAGEGPLPTIMYIHGGPHGPRDHWGWGGADERQMLADRGYVVIQPNFRGSGGFGEEFLESGYRKWYGEMQDDITDATMWAIERGIADKENICIYGASYGGYATLAGLTKTPDLFACGFAFAGVYDLELMYEAGDIQERRAGRNVLDRYIGRDVEELKARSPINFVSNIVAPLYVAHGQKDIRAHIDHYHALLKRLRAENIPFEELLVEKEGHGFYKMENRVDYANKLISFFDQHIGPGSGPK